MAFYPSFFNPNFFWDDERFVFANPEVLQAPHWYSFWNSKSEFFKSWPLGYSFFWSLINYSPFKSFVFYKSLNIIFHGLNAFLIFKIIDFLKLPFAFLLALFFLVHPLQVETVSWIFQLLTIMSFTFFLGSFLFLLYYTDSKKFYYIFFSFLLFLFSLWTKSIALLSPFLFIAIFWIYNTKKSAYFLLIPFLITSFYIGFINIRGTQYISNQKANTINIAGKSLFDMVDSRIQKIFSKPTQKIEGNSDKQYFDFLNKNRTNRPFNYDKYKVLSQAPWHYFSRTLFPRDLHFIYPDIKYHFVLNLISVFLLFIFPILLYIFSKDRLIVLIPMLSLVFITPYLGITNIAFYYWSNVSDRYTYCFLVTLVLALAFLGKRFNNKYFKISLTCYCLFLSFQSLSYGIKFNTPLVMYKEIIEYKPNPVIYSLLFEQYFIKLDFLNAETTLDKGLTQFPNDPQLQQDRVRLRITHQR